MKNLLLLAGPLGLLALAACGGASPPTGSAYDIQKLIVPGSVTIVEFMAPW